ncbi:GDP-mannose pyrophosphorylase, partial [Operophtera brumata]
MLKAVILIGGPQKGKQFYNNTSPPLFPIAGLPLIQHHIEACVKLPVCKEILIIGSYTTTQMAPFVSDMQKEYHVIIRYLQEFTPLGTAGGLYHFRDQVRAGNPAAFFLLNGDAVSHFVEKPNSYVSTLINCGVYVCSLNVFHTMASAFEKKHSGFYKHYLELRRQKAPEQARCQILPDVTLHPTAVVDPTAVIGPNVSVGAGVTIKAGVRLKESIVLNNATINEHALVMYSVVGQDAVVGEWARVEGTPSDPDPNKPFAKMDNPPLFNSD